MKRALVWFVVIAMALGAVAGATAEDGLLSAWGISPTLSGYEIAPVIKELFNLELTMNGDPHHIAGDVKLNMFGYNADIEVRWLIEGYTICFDDWFTKDENSYDYLAEKAARRYSDILAGFVEKFGEPTCIAVNYYDALGIKGTKAEFPTYTSDFDIRNYLVLNEGNDRVWVRAIKNNVVLSIDHKYELNFELDKNGVRILRSSIEIQFEPEPIDIPKPQPSVEPTPKPTNVPTGF